MSPARFHARRRTPAARPSASGLFILARRGIPRRGRAARRLRPSPSAHRGASGGPERKRQQFLVRRLIAVGVGVGFLILIVVGFRGCLEARSDRGLRNYASGHRHDHGRVRAARARTSSSSIEDRAREIELSDRVLAACGAPPSRCSTGPRASAPPTRCATPRAPTTLSLRLRRDGLDTISRNVGDARAADDETRRRDRGDHQRDGRRSTPATSSGRRSPAPRSTRCSTRRASRAARDLDGENFGTSCRRARGPSSSTRPRSRRSSPGSAVTTPRAGPARPRPGADRDRRRHPRPRRDDDGPRRRQRGRGRGPEPGRGGGERASRSSVTLEGERAADDDIPSIGRRRDRDRQGAVEPAAPARARGRRSRSWSSRSPARPTAATTSPAYTVVFGSRRERCASPTSAPRAPSPRTRCAQAPAGSTSTPSPRPPSTRRSSPSTRARPSARFVPFENSIEGAVRSTLDTLAFDAPEVAIVGEHDFPIRHCLIARERAGAGARSRSSSRIRRRAPSARASSASSSRAPRCARRRAPPRRCGSSARPSEPWAALGAASAAELYGCVVLRDGVEDEPDNVTRFVWIAPAGTEPSGDGPVADLAGLLRARRRPARARWSTRSAEFSDRGVNLTRIESRPAARRARALHVLHRPRGRDVSDEPVAEAIEALRSQGGVGSGAGQLPAARLAAASSRPRHG